MNLQSVFSLFVAVYMLLFSAMLQAQTINVYSARNEALIKPLLDKFTRQSGVEIKLLTGKADALLARLESEGKHTPADVLITTDAGRLYRAQQRGLLAPLNVDSLKILVPASYRDPDAYWYGLSVRVRPIIYNPELISSASLSTYEALADAKYKGQICIRSSSNIYNQSLLASMIVAHGEEKAQAWAEGLVANFARPPKGGDRDQIMAAASGQCAIAIANTYYFGGMLAGSNVQQKQAASKLALFWPNQAGRGAHVNISGIGLVHSSTKAKLVSQLIEFLLSDESQRYYADVNFEYPVRQELKASDLLSHWGQFKADTINLSELGRLNADAVKIMDRAGWR